jgi:hypothetical protein
MSKPVRFFWESQARTVWTSLPPSQRDQVRRLLAALRVAPMVGALVRFDMRGRPLRIASAWDTHLVYTLVYRAQEDQVFVVDVFVQEWTPKHTDDPLPPNIR